MNIFKKYILDIIILYIIIIKIKCRYNNNLILLLYSSKKVLFYLH